MSTDEVCIDASVLVGYALPQDAFHEESRQFLRSVYRRDVSRCAPVVVLPECAGPIARRTGDASFGERHAAFVEEFFGDSLLGESVAFGRRSAEIAARHFMRGADAQYVAAAEECDAVLVTWDREMLDRGAAVVDTQTPGQWLDAPADPSAG
jgi:predicted nucleic acid-binding protein